MSRKFFGQPESQLFSVYHAPRGKKHAGTRAALICPPVGQEFIRTHWSLRLLANQLARKGVHVMRFDYSGIGDSAGSIEQIASVQQWKGDISLAIAELKRNSGAETVMLVGQRFGSWLAAEVAKSRPDVNSLVCIEPIINGEEYLNGLRKMHHLMLDFWVCKMETVDDDHFEEILGSQYRRTLLREIEAAQIDFDLIQQPQLIIEAAGTTNRHSHSVSGLQKTIQDDRPSTWYDLRELETAYLRPVMTRTIVKTIDDMFQRLEKLDALKLLTAGA